MLNGVATIPLAGETLATEQTWSVSRNTRRCALPSFFAGNENSLVRVAVEAIFSSQNNGFNPLLLVGPANVGKSHLAHGLARWWQENKRPGAVICMTGAEYAAELADAFERDCLASFRARHHAAQLWILEDIGRLANKQSAQRELQLTLDALERSGAMAVVTSRLPVAEMPGIWPSIAGRLSAGLTVPVAPPGVQSRQALISELATLLGLGVPEAAAELLAKRLAVTVPNLLRILLELSATATLIDSASVRQYLGQRAAKHSGGMTAIVSATARHFGLKVDDLKGMSRNRTVVTARGISMYLARLLTDNSLEKIGRTLGKRDHTTVLHNCRKIEKLIQTDPTTRLAVDKLLTTCRALENDE